ncbi:hypothetical protein Q1695_008474 [Nippostrongylus brasiliensis]|nr:hypothetical protein Q1695_008474 [Nippostrongylus brasiliensis]
MDSDPVYQPLPVRNLTSTIRPTQANQIAASSTLKPTTRSEENETLKEIMSSRAHTLGARNMMSLAELKKGGGKESVSAEVKGSMADFIKGQISSSSTSAVRPAPTLHAPQLGFGLNGAKNITLDVNTTTKPTPSSHDPAKLRAISILKRSKEHSGSNVKTTKRRNVSEDQAETGAKRSKLGALDNKVDLDALMKRKSIHDSEANKAQGIMVQQHLDGLEAREKVETFVTECMSVKDVKVVSCKKCGYTAPRQSELCMREGHAVKRSTAEKRFFKCGSCKKRTVVYSMMPTKPCQHCEANEWIRVAMKDERKVVLENERLMVRGEERKFVNT